MQSSSKIERPRCDKLIRTYIATQLLCIAGDLHCTYIYTYVYTPTPIQWLLYSYILLSAWCLYDLYAYSIQFVIGRIGRAICREQYIVLQYIASNSSGWFIVSSTLLIIITINTKSTHLTYSTISFGRLALSSTSIRLARNDIIIKSTDNQFNGQDQLH